MKKIFVSALALLAGAVAAGFAPDVFAANNAAVADPLRAGFAAPPDSAKISCYWRWLNGNVTKEAITRDLEGMKKQGFGGAIIYDLGAGGDGNAPVPAGPRYGSPEWRELYKHALHEADRLGLALSLNIMSGWNVGGPFVTPEHAAKLVTFSETQLTGPRRVEIALRTPPARHNFYRDIAVVAFPNKTNAPAKNTAGGASAGAAIAPVLTLSASSSQPDYPVAFAADGDESTFWVCADSNPKKPVTPQRPQTFTLTFSAPVTGDALYLLPRRGYGPKACELFAGAGDAKSQPLARFICNPDRATEIKFPATTARQFTIKINSAYDPTYPQTPRNVQIAEIALLHNRKPVKTSATFAAAGAGGTGGAKPVAVKKRGAKLRDFETKIASREGGDSPNCLRFVNDEPVTPGEEHAALADVRDISQFFQTAGGKLYWDVPEGTWTVLRIGYTMSGAHVSTSSSTWGGAVIDYLSADAFRFFWARAVQPLIDDAGALTGKTLRYLHTDSWECGGMNWTPNFAEEFRRRRGYEITPFLPILTGKILDDRNTSNRFLNDFRRTIADLIRDNHYALMQTLAAPHNIGVKAEAGGPHCGPFDSLQLMGLCDVPMSEFWSKSPRHRITDAARFFLKQPASAAHVFGKKFVAAESFTNIGMYWQESFSDNLKPSLDQAFCEGLNSVVWHGVSCSPLDTGFPGQEFFAGSYFGTKCFVFHKSRDFLSYISRAQFLLQQGLFAADVLEFYGENAPNFTQNKQANTAGALPDFDFDTAPAEALLTRISVRDGGICLPDGMRYRALVLPRRNSISLPVLRKVEKWVVEDGLTIIGPKPEHITGLANNTAETDAEVQRIAARLWGETTDETRATGGAAGGVRKVGKGRVIAGKTALEVLRNDGLKPDFERLAGSNKNPRVDRIHRVVFKNQLAQTDLRPFAAFSPKEVFTTPAAAESGVAAHIYFVANLSPVPDTMRCAFRVNGFRAELWDAVTGEISPLATTATGDGRTALTLDLCGYGSAFVVFREPTSAGAEKPFAETTEEKIPLTAPWSVSFEGKWGGPPAPVTFKELVPWQKHDDPRIRFYSGPATYKTTFNLPPAVLDEIRKTKSKPTANSAKLYLQFANVSEIADVKLNGTALGTIWARPFRKDITGAVRAGANTLEIEVVNRWANRVIGDASLPPAQRVSRTNIKRLTPATPLMDSGLTGPAALVLVQSK
ncbi:MAG: hypothetical protein LBR07_02625 [Puniceicoccales bacterium]|jgi:hypothetical protein|nr:hypothetical protein [Puniceicoccales bacterium]